MCTYMMVSKNLLLQLSGRVAIGILRRCAGTLGGASLGARCGASENTIFAESCFPLLSDPFRSFHFLASLCLLFAFISFPFLSFPLLPFFCFQLFPCHVFERSGSSVRLWRKVGASSAQRHTFPWLLTFLVHSLAYLSLPPFLSRPFLSRLLLSLAFLLVFCFAFLSLPLLPFHVLPLPLLLSLPLLTTRSLPCL